jgi:large subunit ribosomal protein L5e
MVRRKLKGPIPKKQKKRSYFMRYQTHFRRRREGKTDYYARRRLVSQDKTKYDSPKYRLVVRATNRYITCQIVYARIIGDFILCAAYSHELPNYGVKLGLTNYAAAYCTGLLLARRLLKKLGMDQMYVGVEKPTGEEYLVEPLEERRPFKCILDLGIKRATTGCRAFGALKGAVDGGLNIPHKTKRFPGFKNKEYDPTVHRHYIFGGILADRMRRMKTNDENEYNKQFRRFVQEGIGPDDIEAIYQHAHELIRKDPSFTKKPKKQYQQKKDFRKKKLSLEQRKEKRKEKIRLAMEKLRKKKEQEKQEGQGGDEKDDDKEEDEEGDDQEEEDPEEKK